MPGENYSSTDPFLQLHEQGKGPNQSLKRSPVGAEEAEQVLGVSLQTIHAAKEVVEMSSTQLRNTQGRG